LQHSDDFDAAMVGQAAGDEGSTSVGVCHRDPFLAHMDFLQKVKYAVWDRWLL
jgi:hypothetical protein